MQKKCDMQYDSLPSDPVMLLSFINMKLRDEYSSLHTLCDDININEQELIDKLKAIDYTYNEESNRFE